MTYTHQSWGGGTVIPNDLTLDFTSSQTFKFYFTIDTTKSNAISTFDTNYLSFSVIYDKNISLNQYPGKYFEQIPQVDPNNGITYNYIDFVNNGQSTNATYTTKNYDFDTDLNMYFEIDGDNYIKIDNKFYKILYVKVSIINTTFPFYYWMFEDLAEYMDDDIKYNIEVFDIKSMLNMLTKNCSDAITLLKPEISAILQFDPDTEIQKLQQQNKETKDLIYHNTIKYTNYNYY